MFDSMNQSQPPPSTRLYFAYGSNLEAYQMTSRCPSATLVGAGTLDDYRLLFAGSSVTWGGGVATVVRSAGDRVEGLVWRVSADDLAMLDRYEGHPFAYRRKRLLIWLERRRRQTQVYVKPRPLVTAPSPDYLRVIQSAYARLGFDTQSLAHAAGGAQ